MIANLGSFDCLIVWLFDQISLPLPKKMYRDKYGEHEYWSMLGYKGLRTATGYEESH